MSFDPPDPHQYVHTPAPGAFYPMSVAPGRVKGSVSEFREGALTLTPDGVEISGKMVLPTGRRILIMVLSLFLGVGILIAAILLEYVIRFSRVVRVPWDCVEDLVLDSPRHRACLVYHGSGDPRQVRSLAFRLPPQLFAQFVQVMGQFAPGRVREGKIGPATPVWAYVLIIVLFFAIMGCLAILASR
jgi:hypothetical protein